MNPQLRSLADRYNVPLSDRSCHMSYMYDGKTIATSYQKEKWDDDCDVLLSLSDPLPIPDTSLLLIPSKKDGVQSFGCVKKG